ncbi:MAG: hypothetical protein PVI50_01005 [Gammaproteobacteria bacterium]|jgi:hypothetical protein
MPETNILLLAGAAAVAIVLLVSPRPRHIRQRAGNAKGGALKKLRHSGEYRAVTIRQGKCAAARQSLGRHYRFEEAPSLPFSGCTALFCSCCYQGLRERRKHQRRVARDRREAVRFDSAHPQRRSNGERRRGQIRWHGADDRH